MRKIILASQSPRRRDLLAQMGLEFEVMPSNFDEQLDDSRSPETVSIELAIGKATTIAEQYPDCIVIGSDTIVTIGGHQLEKPRDEADSHQMIKLLSGHYHDVTSSLAVICKNDNVLLTGADTTKVFFKPYDEAVVTSYVKSGDGADKAAGYGIQSGGDVLIDHIEGHLDTVIGMPTHKLAELLAQIGIQADPVELESPVSQIV